METYKLKRVAHGFRNQEIWLTGETIREWWEVPETDTIWVTVSEDRVDDQQIRLKKYVGTICGLAWWKKGKRKGVRYEPFRIGRDSLDNIRHDLQLTKSQSIFIGLSYVNER